MAAVAESLPDAGVDTLGGTSVDETCAQFSSRFEASPDESTSDLAADFIMNFDKLSKVKV